MIKSKKKKSEKLNFSDFFSGTLPSMVEISGIEPLTS